MDKPFIIVCIEEYVKNPNVASALIRVYNNLVAQAVGAIAVLTPIVLYALYEVFFNLKDLSDLTSIDNWKVVLVIVIQQLIALAKAGSDKFTREQNRTIEVFSDTEGE